MQSAASAQSQGIADTLQPNGASNRRALAVLTTLFFLSGFLAALNDILIPHLKPIFDLNYAQVMLVQFSFFSAFLLFAGPSSKLISYAGYQWTMVTGLITMSAGALLFLPAANVPSFALFMCALVILAGGVTALQVSGNPYVAVLGPARTASSRLTLTQACNSLGSTIAPLFGGLLLLDSGSVTSEAIERMSADALQVHRLEQAAQVKLPYLGIAIALFALALLVAKSRLPPLTQALGSNVAMSGSVWKHRHVCFGVGAIFLAVGGEVAIGSFLVNYLTQADIGALSPKMASVYVSLYWGGSMAGRFLGSAVMRLLPAPKVLGWAAVIVVALLLATVSSSGLLAMWSILCVGLFNSIMFPTIFTLGIANLGPLTGKGSGVLMAAAVGGAIIPVLQGAFADQMGIHPSFLVPALCYAYVAFYGFEGCKSTSFCQHEC